MIDDAIIEALTKIGNHPEVIKICEPDIFCPQELQEWQVKRTLKAIELFQKEWEKELQRLNP